MSLTDSIGRSQTTVRRRVIKTEDLTCLSCGKTWQPRVQNPKKCPYCQRQIVKFEEAA